MTTIKKNTLPAYFKPVFCSLLAALIVLLTFFVRIPLGPLTITLNCLPVAIGAVLLGPLYGAILGAIFGLSSFIMTLTGGGGPLMTMLLGVNPFYTFLMCFVPRVICGWVPGLLFKSLPKKSGTTWLVSSAVCCGLTTLLNTVGFLGLMWIFFRGSLTDKPTENIFVFIFALAGLNALVEFIINLVFGTTISRAMYAATKNKL